MIDLDSLERYRENNRIEAKLAMGGLPESVWETYSSFANTMGGIILLGVEELPDRTLRPVCLPDPEGMRDEFLRILYDRKRVSANILKDGSITLKDNGDTRFLIIEVPRAPRSMKPLYLDNDPSKCYLRSGDGDFRCTDVQRRAMERDALDETQDAGICILRSIDDLDPYTLSLFRKDLAECPFLEGEEDTETESFLLSSSIASEDEEGILHPTAAGLLMFGKPEAIAEEFPSYSPEYLEVSSEGDFYVGGDDNLYTFYLKVRERLSGCFGDDKGTGEALTEALVNCLVNADYRADDSLLIIREFSKITFSNPGGFRIGVDDAVNGGISDPRNAVMMDLFTMTDSANSTGSGIPYIFRLWKSMGWKEPLIAESFEPGKMRVSLTMEDPEIAMPELRDAAQRETLIEHLTDNVTSSVSETAQLLSTTYARARLMLQKMTKEGLLTVEGTNRNKRYRLKEKVF